MTTSSPSTWVIVGTGALGSILGARLIQQQQKVCFVSRDTDQQKLPSQLLLQTEGHTAFKQIVPCYNRSNLHLLPPQAIWVLPVKAWQLQVALNDYDAGLRTAQHILVSHNGMGAAEESLAAYAPEQIIDWVTTQGGWRKSRYHTVHSGLGESWLGFRTTNSNDASTRMPPAWWPLFTQALPKAAWQEDIALKRWQKLAINCAINPLATLAQANNGRLQQAQYLPEMTAVCHEIALLMRLERPQQQHLLPSADELLQQVLLVIQNTAENINSMLQDVRAQRPTEIDYLNGFVHKKGQYHQVPTPFNTRLWQAVLALSH